MARFYRAQMAFLLAIGLGYLGVQFPGSRAAPEAAETLLVTRLVPAADQVPLAAKLAKPANPSGRGELAWQSVTAPLPSFFSETFQLMLDQRKERGGSDGDPDPREIGELISIQEKALARAIPGSNEDFESRNSLFFLFLAAGDRVRAQEMVAQIEAGRFDQVTRLEICYECELIWHLGESHSDVAARQCSSDS